jgi:hypothetical protein
VKIAETNEAIVQDAFEDVALLIGTVAAIHGFEDGIVWTLLRRLDRVRLRTLDRLPQADTSMKGDKECPPPNLSHPALEEFLIRSRVGRRDAQASSKSALHREERELCNE